MTDSEAIKRLYINAYRTTCYGNRVVEHEENLIAIQALEKQMPKKPKVIFDVWLCPCCGENYDNYHDGGYDYCPNCGQKIDWCDKK